MSIYDRARWPSPETNPLVQMLLRGDEWISQGELVAALGLTPHRALLSQGTIFAEQIREDDAAIVGRTFLTTGTDVSRGNGGAQRVFSLRALVLAAMRTNTINAAAFRDWLASRTAEGVTHG